MKSAPNRSKSLKNDDFDRPDLSMRVRKRKFTQMVRESG